MTRIFGIIILIIISFSNSTIAQLVNYSKNGQRTKVNNEKIIVNIIENKDAPKEMTGAPGLSLPGILTNFIGTGISVVKEILTLQQEKYTATYSGSAMQKGLIFIDPSDSSKIIRLNIKEVDFSRIIEDSNTAMKISFVPVIENGSGLFRFKVKSLQIPLTKAKIKKLGKYGKTVDLNIDIKLDALWKEAAATRPDSTKNLENSYQIKSATLGQSTILIPGIVPENDVTLLQSEPYFSGWFQLLPISASQFLNADNDFKAGWYTLTITIKEANPYAITSKQKADFFSSTGNDLTGLLKQLIPANANK